MIGVLTNKGQVNYVSLDDIKWLMKMRKDFYLYINEFDKRRGKNFLKTFPEMEDFYNLCKMVV